MVVKIGDVVEGRYRIIKTLGAGGMGTVFLAEHALIKRRVAIKILHPDLATDATSIERFMNEARAAGTLGHPNIVESTDMGFTRDHVPYIVFEYLEGTLLTDEIYRVGGLPVRRAVRIAEQIASALARRAQRGHRSPRPQVRQHLPHRQGRRARSREGARLRHLALPRGARMRRAQHGRWARRSSWRPSRSPRPTSVDKRADIYALGVILYEMLTARRPFSNDDDPRAAACIASSTRRRRRCMRPEVPHGARGR